MVFFYCKMIYFSMRMKLKKKRKIKPILLILLPILIVSFFSYILYNKIMPLLLNYAEIESKEIAYLIIDKSVDDEVVKKLDYNNLFNVNKTADGNIQSIDFNSQIVNEILNVIGEKIYTNLKQAEKGNLKMIDQDTPGNRAILEVPLGKIFRNPLLNNLGPKVPIKFQLAGAVQTNINTVVKNYGINNAIIEVYIEIEAHVQMILPIASKRTKIANNFLIAMKVIPGNIPRYYSNGLNTSSNLLSIP